MKIKLKKGTHTTITIQSGHLFLWNQISSISMYFTKISMYINR